jgi:hypothetical protein
MLIMIVCALSFLTAAGNANFALATHVLQVETTTVTVGTSFSTSLSQSQQLINGAFTVLSTTGTNLPCEFWTFNFTGNTGQYVSGNFTSDSPVDFYLVQSTAYRNWSKQGTCGSATEAIASQLLITSYAFNAALPSSGAWVIVLVNSSNARNAEGSIVAYLSSGGYTITQPLLNTITTTVASGNTIPAATNIPGFPPESLLIGIVVGLLALLIFRLRKQE